ncbi:MAG: 5'-methylthioadenosine/adenosylhomocysteine nucleosidase [Clostridiales bacterium]|nr:5'-methylthioadenosine/adenosylhomocysteine nucleosidase [Clostridiales bacterium]
MRNNMIGIIGALEEEVNLIKNELTDKKDLFISGSIYTVGKLFNKEVVITKCGVGKVFSAIAAEVMALKFNVECIINTGVAGALSENLSVNDLAIASSVVQHDMDTSPLGDPKGLISGINVINFDADENLIKKLEKVAKELNVNYEKGVIATGDQFISDKAKKEEIKNSFNAIACEMEGGAIGHVAFVNRIPFIVIRTISDNANGDAKVDFPKFLTLATRTLYRLTKRFLELY